MFLVKKMEKNLMEKENVTIDGHRTDRQAGIMVKIELEF